MKYGNIFLFAIPSTLTTGHFNEYFINNSENLYLFLMPLSNHPPKVILYHYHKTKIAKKISFYFYKGKNSVLRYLFFYLYYLWSVLFIIPPKTLILATTPQYCFLSSVFYFLKKIRVVYHVGDYYPGKKGAMSLYQKLVHYYNLRMRYVIYCSPLLEKILRTGKPKVDGNRSSWVFGIKNKPVKRQVIPNLMGYIGMLRPKQGVDIIFDAVKTNKKLKLEIIGDGPLLEELKKTSRKLRLDKRVSFLGLIQDEKETSRVVSRWQIGLAPYDPSRQNMTYYTEPSKIKFYLEYKLPVIMTKITYMARELEKYRGGVCTNFESKSLLKAIKKIQNNYNEYKAGVEDLCEKYEYKKLYDKQFKFFRALWQEK